MNGSDNDSNIQAQTEAVVAGEGPKPRLSVQERFGLAAQAAIDEAKSMTHSQVLAQCRRNSGYGPMAVPLMPIPNSSLKLE